MPQFHGNEFHVRFEENGRRQLPRMKPDEKIKLSNVPRDLWLSPTADCRDAPLPANDIAACETVLSDRSTWKISAKSQRSVAKLIAVHRQPRHAATRRWLCRSAIDQLHISVNFVSQTNLKIAAQQTTSVKSSQPNLHNNFPHFAPFRGATEC